MKRQKAASTENYEVQIFATPLGNPYDPTADTVKMAFLPPGTDPVQDPADPMWNNAFWQKLAPANAQPSYFALCLVGPGLGGVNLAKGIYNVWVHITDSPEVPVIYADQLSIY